MRVQSNSSLKTYQECARLYKYRYCGDRPEEVETEALRVGNEFHEAIEKWPNVDYESVRDPLVRGMLRRYMDDRPAGKFNVVAVEVPWECQVADVELRGYVDKVVEIDGRLYILEHKTTGRDVDEFIASKAIDRQPILYLIAARQAGLDVDAVIFDVTYRPRIRLSRGETEAQFEERVRMASTTRWHPMHVTEIDIAGVEKDVAGLARMLEVSYERDVWPRNPESCYKYSRPCDYLSQCHASGGAGE